MSRGRPLGLMCGALVVAACAPGATDPASTPATTSPASTTLPVSTVTSAVTDSDPTVEWIGPGEVEASSIVDFPDAGSVSLFVAPDGRVHVGLGIDGRIHHSDSEDGSSFAEPRPVSDVEAFVLPFERPAIFVGGDGTTWVAFTTAELDGSIVVSRSASDRDDFETLGPVSGHPAFETVLPRFTAGAEGEPVLAWLADSTARFLTDIDGGGDPVIIDGRTCECCNPAPLMIGDDVVVAYRDLDEDAAGVFRDIAVAVSSDGGGTFSEPVAVSDERWHIDACPISGPSAVADDGSLHVLWMDGRNDDGSFRHTDIWIATSRDGGRSFSDDRRVNVDTGIYHGRPSAVIVDGTLHVVWDSRGGPEGDAIHYSRSHDGGVSFTQALTLVSTAGGAAARPGNATVGVLEDGRIVVSWMDGAGGHVGAWLLG